VSDHNSRFQINDIVLEVAPENITIDRSAHLKQYKPLRTKGTAKVRSPSSVVAITVQAKFIGIQDINNKLRPLVAQFLLTPFCYIENQYLRDSIMGNEDTSKNMGLALQNLTISTVESLPDTWNVIFSFIWFNYSPYTQAFNFKSNIFQSSKQLSISSPGKPFEYFYANQLSKLRPATLNNSDLSLATLEFLIADVNPEDVDKSVDFDLARLRDFQDSSQDLFQDLNKFVDELGVDSTEALRFRQLLSGFQSDESLVKTVQNSINAVSGAVALSKSLKPNDNRLKDFISRRDSLLQESSLIFRGQVWLEFPSETLTSPNRFRAGNKPSKLYYKTKILSTAGTGFNSGLVTTSITINFNHKLAILPMQGYQYPTVQHLGSEDVSFDVSIACLDDESNKALADFWNVSQNNLQFGKFIPQELTSVGVNNELFHFMGVSDVFFSGKRESTTEGHPGLYQHEFKIVENNLKPFDTEQMQAIPTSFKAVRKLVWKAIYNNLTFIVPANSLLRETRFTFREAPLLIDRTILKPKNGLDESSTDFLNRLSPKLKDEFGDLVDDLASEDNFTLGGFTIPENIFLLTSTLSDEQILGIEGANDFIYQLSEGPGNGFNIDRAQTEQARIKLKNDKARLVERQRTLTSLRPTIEKINDRFNDIDFITSTGLALKDGTEIPFSDIFPDQGTRDAFEKDMQDRIKSTVDNRTPATQLRASILSAAGFDQEGNQAIKKVAFISALRGLESELVKLNSLKLDNDFDAELADLFVDWATFTVNVADEVIDRFIDLPIFSEAKAMFTKMTTRVRKSLYADMSFKEIIEYVKQQLNLPDVELYLEPDFYFWNETPDAGLVTNITSEEIQEVKEQTIQYVNSIGDQNLNWYQNKYLKKVNSEMGEFLTQSNPEKQLFQLDMDLQPTPGLTQINSEIDVSNKSINAVTKGMKSGTYQASVNQPGSLPATQDSTFNQQVALTSQPVSAEDSLSSDMSLATGTSQVQAAYGAWLHPMPGASIRSIPGYRNIKELYGLRFHEGTDLGYPRINGRDMTTSRPVFSTLAGLVTRASFTSGSGNAIYIESDTEFGTVVHKYLHLSGFDPSVVVGQTVAAGKLIGFAGNTGSDSTGPHLHFECTIKGTSPDTVIYPFGSFKGDQIITSASGSPTRTVLVGDFINAGQASFQHLPNNGLAGLAGGLSAFDHSLKSLQASWNTDAGYRMNRAYPSVYLAFIEEDLEDAVIYKFDDYFSFASIVSIYMVKDREVAADYVMMQLTNLAGLLSNRKFQGKFDENNPIFQRTQTLEAKDSDARLDPTSVDTDEEYRFKSLLLREGIKAEIRLGYSDNPDNLEVAFIGRITSVQFSESDDLVELEMQSLATELVQDIKGADKVQQYDGLFVSDARTGPLLESLIASPECVSFGFWKRGQKVTNANRDLLTSRWEWNPTPSTDNIFAPPSDHLDPGKFLLGKSIVSKIIGGAVTAAVIGGATALTAGVTLPAAAAVAITSVFGVPGSLIFGGAVLGTAAKEFFNLERRLTPFSALTYYLYQMTIWDVFKEMEHRHPECISSPTPYVEKLGGRTRMTLFFGNPDWLYFSSDPVGTENVKSQEIKDRAEKLKSALQARSNKEDKFKALKEFAEDVNLTDDSLALLPGLVQKINTEADSALIDDVNILVENERLQRATLSGSIRPFRRYHLVTSAQHIVANNIRAKSSNAFNTVTINYASSEDDISVEPDGPQISDVEELTMKLDPLIPDEYVRESVYTYPNCIGDKMAKRYAISHLQKSCWSIYQGDLVILGNPGIKPYDIVFIYDEYSDMYGPVQVRRVTHMFDYEHGFITVIIPDLITTVTEGAALSQMHAMGLMAERFLGLKDAVTEISPGNAMNNGIQSSPWKLALANGALNIASFFGAKKLLFVTQFGHPVRIHPLIKQGQALVAGFGPPGVRENEFVVNDVYEWFLTRSRAVSDSWEDFKRMWDNRENTLNTRGQIFSDEGKFGDADFDALRTGRKRR
jgi:murein DD-endopeptidase MepM/ murein hydrolase activator NlpD